MKTVELICENPLCGKIFEKRKGEYNRSKKLGRRNFCCMKCSGVVCGREAYASQTPEVISESSKRIKSHCGNLRDEYTQFRFFIKVIRQRLKDRHKTFDIDLKYLKDLWESQNGICPFTGWNLVLPDNIGGWKTYRNGRRASLDRIDNSKGYVSGNLRFISFMANIARSNMTDEELVEFCKAVADNSK